VPRSKSHRPRILLAGLDPILELGMARKLVDGGAIVVQAASPDVTALARNADEERPDAIVIGDGGAQRRDTAARLRAAAPGATLVLWPKDTDAVAVMRPGDESPRLMPVTAADELLRELFSPKGDGCPST